jgi:hypothetical protein
MHKDKHLKSMASAFLFSSSDISVTGLGAMLAVFAVVGVSPKLVSASSSFYKCTVVTLELHLKISEREELTSYYHRDHLYL